MKRFHKLCLGTILILALGVMPLLAATGRHDPDPDVRASLGNVVLELAQGAGGEPLLESPEGPPRGPRPPRPPNMNPPRRMEREMVRIFENAVVEADKSVPELVTVFGDARVEGEVRGDMVVVMGSADIDGPVNGNLIVVMGGVTLREGARVSGDLVVVGGALTQAAGARINGERIVVSLANVGVRVNQWFRSGLFMLRPLPPGAGLAWMLVLLHFLAYLVLVVLIPRPVAACVSELRLRLGPAFLVGLLALVLSVPLTFVLIATGVGVILLPFLVLILTGAVFLGKAATLQHIGEQATLRLGATRPPAPFAALCFGSLLIALVYMVPLLGLVAWGVLLPLAVGAVLLALAESFRHSGQKTGAIPQATPPGLDEPPEVDPTTSTATATTTSAVPLVAPEPQTRSSTRPGRKSSKTTSPPPKEDESGIDWTPGACCPGASNASSFSPAELAVMPRVGFWLRLVASFLDFVLLLWVLPVAHRWFVPIWLTYHIAMWLWKGTTVGGIVCGLKLVRLDGRPVDFGVALVRALASVFSLMALGIGFFWAGWMPERQSWHDRIAGTAIVKLPKGVSLI